MAAQRADHFRATRKATVDTKTGSVNFTRGHVPIVPNPTRVLIVASELEVFCAGADLKERAKMTIDESVLSSLLRLFKVDAVLTQTHVWLFALL